MFTFSTPLDEITEADLQRLVEDSVEENRQLEYKRELPGTGTEEKKNLSATSFFTALRSIADGR
jgi:hypothetical protein